ncbi:hypothetical protein [Geomicrobium sp. JCM 19055]|uniref:hypothetical protein n=1 Tax=Geomicrobium sp. JCM 19055 TaxID=1460649 RepID=UPI00045ECFDB|nr:hypothetical protein [Geomicrobium sp. JCM 19055]GAJ98570.1 hypothetical protein JCM19055_1511 [Geomicrobium sp. JCM 19055]
MWLIQELGMRESHNAKYYQFIEDNLKRYENNEPMLMMNVNDISMIRPICWIVGLK